MRFDSKFNYIAVYFVIHLKIFVSNMNKKKFQEILYLI